MQRLLARVSSAEDIDETMHRLGQNQCLARSAAVLAEQVLELRRQGLTATAVARELGLSRVSVSRLLAKLA